jgi:hypothetical protein
MKLVNRQTQQLLRAFSSTQEAYVYYVLIHRRAAHCISVVSVMDSRAEANSAWELLIDPYRGRHRDHIQSGPETVTLVIFMIASLNVDSVFMKFQAG